PRFPRATEPGSPTQRVVPKAPSDHGATPTRPVTMPSLPVRTEDISVGPFLSAGSVSNSNLGEGLVPQTDQVFITCAVVPERGP
ncbi:MAG: hypothetical protein AAFQ51_11380, partial [Pseudomonadota bacterium]